MNEPVAWIDEQGEVFSNPLSAIRNKAKGKIVPLYTHPVKEQEPTVPKNMQEWKGMDGATAYLLIDRHADNWADAKQMMEEWLEANSNLVKELDEQFKKGFEAGKEEGWKAHKFHHPVKELTDEEIEEVWLDDVGLKNTNYADIVRFARAILRKAQEK